MNVVMMNFFVGWTTPVNDIGTSEWCEDPKIEGKVVKVQLDVGAKVNFISSNVICKILHLATPMRRLKWNLNHSQAIKFLLRE